MDRDQLGDSPVNENTTADDQDSLGAMVGQQPSDRKDEADEDMLQIVTQVKEEEGNSKSADAGTGDQPKQQFIQLNIGDGQTQMIPVTGQAQYIQLLQQDGSYQIIEVSPSGEVRYIQLDGSGDFANEESGSSSSDKDHPGRSTGHDPGESRAELKQSTLGQESVSSTLTMSESVESQIKIEPDTEISAESSQTKGNKNTEGEQDELSGRSIPTNAEADREGTSGVSSETSSDASQQALNGRNSSSDKVVPVPQATPTKILDLQRPLKLTSDTVVMVDGKKCVLRVDPETKHLVAYPFIEEPVPGKRRRGRPRKVVKEGTDDTKDEEEKPEEDVNPKPTEEESNAAQGLLGLSDSADGRRKSNRQKRRAQFLRDYETGPVEGDEEEEVEGGTVDDSSKVSQGGPVKRGRGRPPKAGISMSQVQSMLVNMGIVTGKRGRGRPRRYPPKDSSSGPIPAFIIPSSGGQAVVMAPLPGLQNVKKTLTPVRPKGLEATGGEIVATPSSNPPIIIQHPDGRQTHVTVIDGKPPHDTTLHNVDASKDSVQDELSQTNLLLDPDSSSVAELTGDGERDADDASLNMDSSLMSDMQDEQQELAASSSATAEDGLVVKAEDSTVGAGVEGDLPAPAVIQLPQNLVPLLVPRKEPIKLGLKQTQQQLHKLKCPKCDFQAYYPQQFQDHLSRHPEDIEKCKCCPYVTLDKEELTEHFKDAHPKCICTVCGFTAEHGYIVKRHMMRHNPDGCQCNICGKRYKDQYIMKMHIKLVHMPAEVLYECNICGKKFTRKAHLKRHLRIHEPEKPFKCPHCDYRGCERSDITKHLLIHDEPRHVCEVCGKPFRHMKNKELHVKRHRGQRDYKCGICDFYGYTFTDIRKHIERKHADSKAVVCDKCGIALKSEALFKDHRPKCQAGEFNLMEHTLVPVSSVMAGDATTDMQQPMLDSHLTVGEGGQVTIDGTTVNITVEDVPDGMPVDLPSGHMVSETGDVTSSPVELAHIPVSGVVTHITDIPADAMESDASVIEAVQVMETSGELIENPDHVEMEEELVQTQAAVLDEESISTKISMVSLPS